MKIEQKILEANALEHDIIADAHDRNVPYYSYAPCRKRYTDSITSLIKSFDRSDVKVLELGCGTGEFSREVIEAGAAYTGVDISPKMIELCKSKFSSIEKMTFMVGSIQDLIQRGEKFDIVFSTSFLHHLPDLRDFKNQLLKILEEDSSVFLGLHEPIIPKAQSFKDKVDYLIASIRGFYMGELSFPLRILYVACGNFNRDQFGEPRPWINPWSIHLKLSKIKRMILSLGLIKSPLSNNVNEKEYDESLVDYQLNSDFNGNLRKIFPVEDYVYGVYKFSLKSEANYMRVCAKRGALI